MEQFVKATLNNTANEIEKLQNDVEKLQNDINIY